LDTHQGLGDEAGCLPTLMSRADPARPLLISCHKCGHPPAGGSDPGLRDGAKQETPAIWLCHMLWCRTGPCKSFEGYDRGSPVKLEEARWTSLSDLAKSGHIRPAPSEPWSECGLEKGSE